MYSLVEARVRGAHFSARWITGHSLQTRVFANMSLHALKLIRVKREIQSSHRMQHGETRPQYQSLAVQWISVLGPDLQPRYKQNDYCHHHCLSATHNFHPSIQDGEELFYEFSKCNLNAFANLLRRVTKACVEHVLKLPCGYASAISITPILFHLCFSFPQSLTAVLLHDSFLLSVGARALSARCAQSIPGSQQNRCMRSNRASWNRTLR